MHDIDLPEFIDEETLRDIETVNVPDEVILDHFEKVDRPWLSKSAVAEMTNLGDEAARKRLNSLVERGVLKSDTAGKQTNIYWLNDPRSAWPVPDDLKTESLESDPKPAETVFKINRVGTLAVFYAGFFVLLYVLDWVSKWPATNGVFNLTLSWSVMPMLSLALLGVLFYVTLQTSLVVENSDVGWPTIRRVYRGLFA